MKMITSPEKNSQIIKKQYTGKSYVPNCSENLCKI